MRVVIIEDDAVAIGNLTKILSPKHEILVLRPWRGVLEMPAEIKVVDLDYDFHKAKEEIRAAIEAFQPEVALLDDDLKCSKWNGRDVAPLLTGVKKIIGISTIPQPYTTLNFTGKYYLGMAPEIAQDLIRVVEG